MRIKIDNDVFDIVARLHEINRDYEVFFDTNLQKFVLERKCITELVFPYDALDIRAVNHALYTKVENMNEVVADLEKNNEDMAKKSLSDAQNKVEDEFSKRMRNGG